MSTEEGLILWACGYLIWGAAYLMLNVLDNLDSDAGAILALLLLLPFWPVVWAIRLLRRTEGK